MTREKFEDIYSLSPLQQGMLFHMLHAPESGQYFEQLSFWLDGGLDRSLFQSAWMQVVQRHPALRTCFVWQGVKEPVQVVHRQGAVEFHVEDWRQSGPEHLEDRWHQLLQQDQKRGFALDRLPLMRFRLIQEGEACHRFLWSYPHLLLDGWSVPTVLQEVFAVYEALRQGAEPRLPPARPFREYILWLKQQDTQKQAEFWRQELATFDTVTPFPTHDTAPGSESENLDLTLDAESTQEIRAFSQRHRLTLNAVAQGAWALLLHRWTGREDVVFGVTSAGRPPEVKGIESMVGLFLNTVPARIPVDPSRPLGEWLQEVQGRHLKRQPFEWAPLWEVQGQSQIPAGQALFHTLFVFENFPMPTTSGEKANLQLRRPDVLERTNYPITLGVSARDRVSVRASFYPGCVPPSEMRQIVVQYLDLLKALARAPAEARLGDLSVLSRSERHQLKEWSLPQSSEGAPPSFSERFWQAVQKHPGAVALQDATGHEMTFETLGHRCLRLAAVLQSLGVGPESTVGLLLPKSSRLVEALLGVLEAGGAFVPLDPSYPRERLQWMAKQSGIQFLLAVGSTANEPWLKEVPNLEVLNLDDSEVEKQRGELPASRLTGGRDPDQLAYVIFTSGSTGRPKPVGIPRRGLDNLVVIYCDELRIGGPGQRILGFASPSFDASVTEYVQGLSTGSAVIFPPADLLPSSDLTAWMRRERIGVATLPPSSLSMLASEDLPELQVLISAGEDLPEDLAREWSGGRHLFNGYGPTEVTVCATAARCSAGSGKPPIGHPVAGKAVYLTDPYLRWVPRGAVGEIVVGGEFLARGYLGRPGETARRFVPDPFGDEAGGRLYRTGDLATWRFNGELEFLGRLDRQLKIRGFRVEPSEVEAALREDPQIREAIVDAIEGDRLVAWVVPADDASPSARGLRERLARTLPEHLLPSQFEILDEIPRTPSGKIDRSLLIASLESSERPSTVVGDEARNPLERTIAEIWCQVLGIDAVGVHQSFFEIGGHSLRMVAVHGHLEKRLGRSVPLVELLRRPTIAALAMFLADETEAPDDGLLHSPRASSAHRRSRSLPGEADDRGAIAIIGMAGRFPGARDLREFWAQLSAGKESISFFSREELEASGYSRSLIEDPAFVPAAGVLSGAELFDARYFQMTPREARFLDPQHRLFLEGVVEALDDAGYGRSAGAAIGVFAGCSMGGYGLRLLAEPGALESVGAYQATLANDKDFLPTRVSHRLDLRGPSVNVQTACSTSLVAVHMACQSLLLGECEVAVAGGVSVLAQRKRGYLFQEGGIASPDGHCRAFDAKAAGTVGGEGLGVVVLKPLGRALKDGDTIRAVIRGSALNNDGAAKVGYAAPSVDGQASVIASALESAGWGADDIDYVEAHGTGTALGDAVEVAALGEIFGCRSEELEDCWLGSVKTNLGHADAAAGVAGLIKTALALEAGQIPPSLHFEKPNPQIDFRGARLRVASQLAEWPRTPGRLRRAAVSSFGIGGTNAHVVLEQAPLPGASRTLATCSSETPVSLKGEPRERLLMISAVSDTALEEVTDRLLVHLHRNPQLDLRDVAFTLQVGRRSLACRRFLTAWSLPDALSALALRDPDRLRAGTPKASDRPVVFLFPGQGSQRPRMGRATYDRSPAFRQAVDRCCETLRTHLALDLRELLYPEPQDAEEAARRLQETELAQPALFVVEYALGRQLMEWGVRPAAMLGHSLGEWVAACLAEVLPVEEALEVVALRGRLMQAQESGGMVALPLSREQVEPLLGEDLALAADNGPRRCVVSGSLGALEALAPKLVALGVEGQSLKTSHAFHSASMDGAMAPFLERLKRISWKAPRVPFVSNLSGTWIRPEEATDPQYWVRHLREPVEFSAGVRCLLESFDPVFLEVGPGRALGGLVRHQEQKATVLSLQASRKEELSALQLLGHLFLAGAEVTGPGLFAGETPRRVPLPTTFFERERFWIEGAPRAEPELAAAGQARAFLPSWRPLAAAPRWSSSATSPPRCLVLSEGSELGEQILDALKEQGIDTLLELWPGPEAASSQQSIPESRGLSWLVAEESSSKHVLLLCGHRESSRLDSESLSWSAFLKAQESSLYRLRRFVALLARDLPGQELRLQVITAGGRILPGGDGRPELAPLLAVLSVVGREHPNIQCRNFDLDWESTGGADSQSLARTLAADILREGPESTIAYRGRGRWTQALVAIDASKPSDSVPWLPSGSVFVLTGGLGRLGLVLIRWLMERFHGRCAIITRSLFPAREDWDDWLEARGSQDQVSRKILLLRQCESAGGHPVSIYRGDVADSPRLSEILNQIHQQLGPITGVFHLAGNTDLRHFRPLAEASPRDFESHFRPKVAGVLALKEALAAAPLRQELRFCVLFSSLASLVGGVGSGAYGASNAFLDAFAQSPTWGGGLPWISIAWSGWSAGFDEEATQEERLLSEVEGLGILEQILWRSAEPALAVSKLDISLGVDALSGRSLAVDKKRNLESGHRPRGDLASTYKKPGTAMEGRIAGIWQEFLGIDGIGINDDFFALGGDSLLATEVMSRIRREVGLTLPLSSLLEAPTVGNLAALIEAQQVAHGGKE